jgi:hypothetical protein
MKLLTFRPQGRRSVLPLWGSLVLKQGDSIDLQKVVTRLKVTEDQAIEILRERASGYTPAAGYTHALELVERPDPITPDDVAAPAPGIEPAPAIEGEPAAEGEQGPAEIIGRIAQALGVALPGGDVQARTQALRALVAAPRGLGFKRDVLLAALAVTPIRQPEEGFEPTKGEILSAIQGWLDTLG